MGSKNNPGEFSCYEAAAPDEPMFILLGRDKQAPARVRDWAFMRETAIQRGEKPSSDMEKVREARQCAADMETYRRQREGTDYRGE
jgi:hypothetical protein